MNKRISFKGKRITAIVYMKGYSDDEHAKMVKLLHDIDEKRFIEDGGKNE